MFFIKKFVIKMKEILNITVFIFVFFFGVKRLTRGVAAGHNSQYDFLQILAHRSVTL